MTKAELLAAIKDAPDDAKVRSISSYYVLGLIILKDEGLLRWGDIGLDGILRFPPEGGSSIWDNPAPTNNRGTR